MRISNLSWKSTFKVITLYQQFSMGEQYCNKFKWMWMYPAWQAYLDSKSFNEKSILNHFIHLNPFFLALVQINLWFFQCLCIWKGKIYCWTLGGNENEKFSLFKMFVWLGKKKQFPKSWTEVTIIASSETYF